LLLPGRVFAGCGFTLDLASVGGGMRTGVNMSELSAKKEDLRRA
jgi:hypothetical protein